MGTTWAVTLNAPGLDRDAQARVRARVQAELDAVDAAMSTWDPDSEVSRFNRHAASAPFAVSAATFEVVRLARGVFERSGGAFDPTVRPLVAAWGFGADARVPGEGPSAAERAALGARVGFDRLVLDPTARTLTKAHPGLELDLSAIAKGYGVDRVADALLADGHADFLVEVGGELRAEGTRPDGTPWRLAIERPEPEGRAVHAVVPLTGLAMATSGDYRAFHEAGGVRRTHIIDPRTGAPIAHGLASVTVLHPRAVLADAWATTLSVLGPDEGFALAEREGIAAYGIVRETGGRYRIRRTSGFPPVEEGPAAP